MVIFGLELQDVWFLDFMAICALNKHKKMSHENFITLILFTLDWTNIYVMDLFWPVVLSSLLCLTNTLWFISQKSIKVHREFQLHELRQVNYADSPIYISLSIFTSVPSSPLIVPMNGFHQTPKMSSFKSNWIALN